MKYSYEEKLAAVLSVVNGQHSVSSASKHFGISYTPLSRWIARYKELQAHLQRLLERVSALHSLSAQPTTVRWLTAEEVCKALSITKRALQYYRSAGIIPYTALGNKVLFRDDDIRHLLEKNLIKSL